jgi:hypothetical protein
VFQFSLASPIDTIVELRFQTSEFRRYSLFLGIEVYPTSMGLMLWQVYTWHSPSSRYVFLQTCWYSYFYLQGYCTAWLLVFWSYSVLIIGALQYLTFTRPNICFVVNKVCQFIHTPIDAHWAAIKCIMCYLKSMVSSGLHIIHSSSFALHGFIDVK